ncbi:MAG: hypothetical protein V2A61_03605 [Calditrichota bacterium]
MSRLTQKPDSSSASWIIPRVTICGEAQNWVRIWTTSGRSEGVKGLIGNLGLDMVADFNKDSQDI